MRRAKLRTEEEAHGKKHVRRKAKVMFCFGLLGKPKVGLFAAFCLCVFSAVTIFVFLSYYKDLFWKEKTVRNVATDEDSAQIFGEHEPKGDEMNKTVYKQPSLKEGRFQERSSLHSSPEEHGNGRDLENEERLLREKVEENIKKKGVLTDKKHYTKKKHEEEETRADVPDEDYYVLLQLVNASPGSKFADNFYNCLKSIMKRTKLEINFLLTVDDVSKITAEKIFQNVLSELKMKKMPQRTYYLIDEINKKVFQYTKGLQELFSSGQGAYYSHAIFFIAPAMHKILPSTINRLIMLDTDLQFRADIKELFALFRNMSSTNILALATDQQPVYRHVLWSYRSKHPGTKVGEPPPNGYTGFNSGVKLMNLEGMRNSKLYNELILGQNASRLASKYDFKGHLGDQDFYSLISFDYPTLFYTLPCQWNRQLCFWWKNHGYEDVFDLYFKCKPPYFVLHGNCNTPIPAE